MNHDLIFSITNTTALLAWIVLILFGNSIPAHRLIHSGAIPALFSVIYVFFAAQGIYTRAPGGFDSLQSVAQLFQSRDWLLAGWIHYLAFDLWVGAWIARDARKNGYSPFLISPLLILTFLLGPVGYLAYSVTRLRRT